MGKRESYEPGTFSWVELATSDADAAKRFYGELFGWEYEDNPIGGGAVYSMAKVDGAVVAALYASDQPPHWNSYVTVASADEAAEKVKEAGGTVAAEPFDVLDVGRMTVIQDPTGAPLCLWEAKERIGADAVNVHGGLTWNDLMTNDVQKAVEFYGAVFGWEVAPVDEGGRPADEPEPEDAADEPEPEDDGDGDRGEAPPPERVTIRNGERLNGGIAKLPEHGDDVPPHWLPYFAVEDMGTATKAVDGGGGKVVIGPMDVPAGALAVCADPQGAIFAIFAGELED